ncbi:MAG: 4Fe-4S dicluster domain-containing protein [candidate division Zixibacteria bacterium]|nr:4Fe-4S dicluster domain-containing protein [candidate division Zixibacteria bacterium]
MKSQLIVTPNLCIGCRTCELACSFNHAISGKPGRSRIFVLDGGFKDLWVSVACLQCDDPACVKSCLVDALRLNEETGAIELNQDKCVKCMACTVACPFGCSVYDATQDLVVKCDLCEGDPACARFCPTKALVYKPVVQPRAVVPKVKVAG